MLHVERLPTASKHWLSYDLTDLVDDLNREGGTELRVQVLPVERIPRLILALTSQKAFSTRYKWYKILVNSKRRGPWDRASHPHELTLPAGLQRNRGI